MQKIKAIVFGASGMVGRGVLLECLESSLVESVLVVGRSAVGLTHPKLTEVIHHDFMDYSDLRNALKGVNACFFCLGVSALGMTEEKYHRITHDFTVAAAQELYAANPSMTFCYVSGAGTDSTEKSRRMWARVKGKTENALKAYPFKAVYLFRPGYIQPMKGVRSKVGWYQALYVIFKPLFFLFKAVAPGSVTSTVNVGKAMIAVANQGFPSTILTPKAINQLAHSIL